MNQFGSGIFYFTGINYLNQLISVSKLWGRSEKLNNRRNNFWMPYLQKDCGSLPVLLKLVCLVIHPPWEKLLLSSNRSISERLFCFRRWMTSLCFHSQKTRSRIPLSSYNKTFSTYLWDPALNWAISKTWEKSRWRRRPDCTEPTASGWKTLLWRGWDLQGYHGLVTDLVPGTRSWFNISYDDEGDQEFHTFWTAW